MSDKPSRYAIVWFREDLRLADNPALRAAAQSRCPLLCLYIHDQESESIRPLGGAAKWWLHGTLAALRTELVRRGGELTLLHGGATGLMERLAADLKPAGVYWNRRYDAAGRAIDHAVESAVSARGVAVRSFNGGLLREPWEVVSRAGTSFRIFTAYWRAAQSLGPPAPPSPRPRTLQFARCPPSLAAQSTDLAGLGLEPRSPDWAGGLRTAWRCGEAAAQKRLEAFLQEGLHGYAAGRDRPDRAQTSHLSPSLRFGEISPRQIWHRAHSVVGHRSTKPHQRDLEVFLGEIGWREFNYHLLHHAPDLARRNLQPSFDTMPWREDPTALRAWQRGLTGYPIVDAGMRELWATGWMHNRVRMIASSFLVKHLLIDWRAGEAWFWDTLVDADPANNGANWQWVAGSGTDAAPFFRIFNPMRQGEKFDPDGAYVRRWVPELSALPASVIHRPWTATAGQLSEAGIRLGQTYPLPIVAHEAARARALEAWRGRARPRPSSA